MNKNQRQWELRGGRKSSLPLILLFLGISLSLLCTNPAFAADAVVDDIAKALTELEPGSAASNKALASAGTLTDAQAAAVAQKVLDKVKADTKSAVNALLNLYKLGLKAAPVNPLLKKLGEKLAAALKLALGGLLDLLLDPRNVVHGKLQVNRVLELLGISDINKRMDIIEQLELAVKKEEEKKKETEKRADSKSDESMAFDASTATLSFTHDFITGIFDFGTGTTSITDTLVGAEVVIPNFLFDGITPEGEPGFANPLRETLIVRKGPNIFFEALVPYLIWNGSSLFGFATDLILSGASPGSPYTGGLPDLGSSYMDHLNTELAPFDYRFYFEFSITPGEDIVAASDNFNRDFVIHFGNGFGLARTIDEPSTLIILLLGSTLLLWSYAFVRPKRERQIESKPI